MVNRLKQHAIQGSLLRRSGIQRATPVDFEGNWRSKSAAVVRKFVERDLGEGSRRSQERGDSEKLERLESNIARGKGVDYKRLGEVKKLMRGLTPQLVQIKEEVK